MNPTLKKLLRKLRLMRKKKEEYILLPISIYLVDPNEVDNLINAVNDEVRLEKKINAEDKRVEDELWARLHRL